MIRQAPTHGIPRRRFLGAAAAVAGGAALGPFGGTVAAAGPQAAAGVTTLIVQPWRYDGSKVFKEVMTETLDGFLADHPGVAIQLSVGEKPPIPLLISGAAPDVIQANDQSPYLLGNFILPLDDYIRQDNVDLSAWPALQIGESRWQGKLHGLPSYFNMVVMSANLTAIDDAGLDYPAPNWTAADFVRLSAALTTVQNGKRRYGGSLPWTVDGPTDMTFVLEGFGGALMDGTASNCLVGDAGSLAAGSWIYGDLLWPQICSDDLDAVVKGTAVLGATRPDQLIGGDGFVVKAKGFNWDFWPMPAFPKGPACNAPAQYYMINSATAHPDLAWDLVKWITAEAPWQEMMMRLMLIPPSLTKLAAEWESVVQAVAPPLQGKALHVFGDAMSQNYAYPYRHFAYDDAQATAVLAAATATLAAHKADVPTAFGQAAAQINAMETSARSEIGLQTAAAQRFPSAGPPMATVPEGL